MAVANEAEEYVKTWCESKGREFKEKHKEGYDLKFLENGKEIFVEVKGSSKNKFKDFRPYITLSELKKAIEKGNKYEFHILLGLKGGKPKEHYIFKGSKFAGYESFVDEAIKFQNKWSEEPIGKVLWPEVRVYLKKNIGEKVKIIKFKS